MLWLFARARTPWLTDVAHGISAAGSGWGATVIGLSAVVLTMVFRRWRHLLVFLCSLFALTLAMDVTTERMTVFPVACRRGNTAHVDVTGRRGEAIRQGVRDQLGFTVTGITPVGLASSAGSTPLRLRAGGTPQEYLFGKLYTKGHVRADRWYKIWRTILYGSLEDEHPFQTVRRLAEYEDYALRLLQDAGIAVPRPYGIVEITPNGSTCSSPSTSTARWKSGTPTSTTS